MHTHMNDVQCTYTSSNAEIQVVTDSDYSDLNYDAVLEFKVKSYIKSKFSRTRERIKG